MEMKLYQLAERLHKNGIISLGRKALRKQTCITWPKGLTETKLYHLVERPHENRIVSLGQKATQKWNCIAWPKGPTVELYGRKATQMEL